MGAASAPAARPRSAPPGPRSAQPRISSPDASEGGARRATCAPASGWRWHEAAVSSSGLSSSVVSGVTLFSEASMHNDAHTTPSAMDALKWMCGIFTRPRLTAAIVVRRSSPQEAFPGLPDHLVVTHILRAEHFDDPADLARLPVVSRAMRDAVAETGLPFEEIDEDRAVRLGCLSAVRRMQRGGRLSCQEYLCAAAARSGQLEELKVLRADGCPWDTSTCWSAARGGHLEVLQWARENGCPWDEETCADAAYGGHLEVLQWARTNGCPWNGATCAEAA